MRTWLLVGPVVLLAYRLGFKAGQRESDRFFRGVLL